MSLTFHKGRWDSLFIRELVAGTSIEIDVVYFVRPVVVPCDDRRAYQSSDRSLLIPEVASNKIKTNL